MATAKQLLYVQGIGSQISSGAWTRLAEEARLPGFDHAFLWVRGRQFLAGRLWASCDGKRRSHFPMVVLVHGLDGLRNSALASILTQLENIAAACRAARSADHVREVIADAWGGARETTDSDPAALDESDSKDATPTTLCVPPSLMLQIAGDFRESVPPFSRLPADPYDVTRNLCFWPRVFTALAPAETPLLFMAPLGQPWLDVLACEPPPEKFFCLRAALQALPIARGTAPQDLAAEMDADEFVKTASGGAERSWISRWLRH
jgi:hypothetical protein